MPLTSHKTPLQIDTPVRVRLTCQMKSDNNFWSDYAIIMIGCCSLHFRSRMLWIWPATTPRVSPVPV